VTDVAERAALLKDRLTRVEDRIAEACRNAGRSRQDITLIAVTKTFPAELIRDAHELGIRDFGENYVQEFTGKAPALSDLAGARFHLIGHLQSNKTRQAAELFHVVQTVDSAKVARRLNDSGKRLDVMVEVKLAEEESKYGIDPAGLPEIIDSLESCSSLRLRGLMTMPPWSEDAEQSRPYFRRLAQLGREHGLQELSMGMSHDFEVAIEEGATWIRVGTALFGSRKRA
jgi:pyridoxal phosphate enzyme (YggS family)